MSKRMLGAITAITLSLPGLVPAAPTDGAGLQLAQTGSGAGTPGAPGDTRDMQPNDDYDPARDAPGGDPMDRQMRTNEVEQSGNTSPMMDQGTKGPDAGGNSTLDEEAQEEEDKPWYRFWE